MPWYGWIHPVLAVAALVWGISFVRVSMVRMGEWDFPLRRVRGRTFIFFGLCGLNFIIGLVVNSAFKAQNVHVKLIAHLPLSIAAAVLALLAVLVTFGRAKPGEQPESLRWHPVLMVTSLGFILTNGFLYLLNFIL